MGSQRDVFSCSRQIAWPQDLTVAGHRSPNVLNHWVDPYPETMSLLTTALAA